MRDHPRTAFSALPSAQASYSETETAAQCFNSSHVFCPFVDVEGREPESQNGSSPRFGRNWPYAVLRLDNILHLYTVFERKQALP